MIFGLTMYVSTCQNLLFFLLIASDLLLLMNYETLSIPLYLYTSIFFKYSLYSFLSETPIMCMLVTWPVSHRLLRFCPLFFILFSSPSDWMISPNLYFSDSLLCYYIFQLHKWHLDVTIVSISLLWILAFSFTANISFYNYWTGL